MEGQMGTKEVRNRYKIAFLGSTIAQKMCFTEEACCFGVDACFPVFLAYAQLASFRAYGL